MIHYNLKNSKRAKRLRITINRSGNVTIIKPWFVPQFFVNNFIKEKSQWIKDNVSKMKKRKEPLFHIPRRNRVAYLREKENTRRLVYKIINKYNEFNQFEFKQIRIKNPKTIWGSCSQDKNLNFSYRLIYLPLYMAEYIVVHELCHLKELNHSKQFWELVRAIIPTYKEIRKELKNI